MINLTNMAKMVSRDINRGSLDLNRMNSRSCGFGAGLERQ